MIDYEKLDSGVVDMVTYFNEQGLETIMSCSGHEGQEYMHFFWIEFNPRTVTYEDIVNFMEKRCAPDNGFVARGFFCDRFSYDGERWYRVLRYVASSVIDAEEDLRRWKEYD